MHLSRYTDYAYRVLLYTAVNPKRCTLKEISAYYDVSIEHLRKVVHSLGQLNYLRTYKGKSGGMELNIDPEDINLADIYKEFEMVKESVIDCRRYQCLLTPNCQLKKILHGCEQAFIKELEQFTLRDLMDNRATKLLLVAEA